MPQVIVAARLEFATQESRDEAVRLAAPVQRDTRTEAGCLTYCFAADPALPTCIQVFELWEDRASLLAHFSHPYYAQMVKVLRGVGVVRSCNQVWDTGDHGPVYEADGKPNSEFFKTGQ